MLGTLGMIFSLLLGMAALLIGTGLAGTALSLRAGMTGLSPGATGIVMSAYFVGYVLGTYYCPSLIRRVGHIRAFAAMASAASSAILLIPVLDHPLAWAAMRVIAGVCMVGLYMTVESWLNVIASNTNRGRLFATYQLVCLTSIALGQYLLLAGDVAGFIPFVLSSVFISLSLIPVALTTVEQPRPVAEVRVGLGHLYRLSPSAMTGGLNSGLLNGTLWGMGPLFVLMSGRSELGVATFMVAVIMGGAVLQWPVGLLSDRFDRRTVLTGVGVMGALFALGVNLAVDASLSWFSLAGFLYGGMAFSVYSISVAHMNDVVEADHVLEAARGLLLLHGIGAMAGPVIGGFFMTAYGAAALPCFLGGVLLLTGAMELSGRIRRPRTPPEESTEFVPMLRSSPAAIELDPRLETNGETRESPP